MGEPVPLVVAGPQMASRTLPYFVHRWSSVDPVPGEVAYLRQIPRGNIIFGGSSGARPRWMSAARNTIPPGSWHNCARSTIGPSLRHARVIRTMVRR
jgi:sarcosine oxidase subunit beta